MKPLKLEYKTYEQLKEELGDKYDIAMYEINLSAIKEIDHIHSIIKEVREYIELELSQGGERDIRDLVNGYAILEILDKEIKE